MEKMNRKTLLLNIDVVIASLAMCLLVALTFAGVIARYIVGKPFGWTEEIQAALIVWVIFCAAGAAFRTANHAAIEILYEIFPKSLRRVIDIFILIVTIGVLVLLSKSCIDYINMFVKTGRSTAVLHIPFVAIYSITPISCVWQVVNYVLVTFCGISEKEVIESITNEEFEEAQKK